MKRAVLIAVLVGLALATGCTKREDLVVARVDTRTITVADVENAVLNLEEKYMPENDDLEGRMKVLNHMINKEVMALKALGAGYDKEEWFVEFWDSFRKPFLVAAMMEHQIRRKVTVTDAEVDDYFEKMHWEYTISQIVVPNEDQAWELRQRILDGADFAETARKYSFGAEAEEGGFVGSSNVGRILWWVEEALFGMEEQDVSEPLQTSSGYALIKVHRKRRIVPDDTKEFARARVKAIKEQKGIEEVKARIEKEIGLTFSEQAVTIAYDNLPQDYPMEDVFVNRTITRDNAPVPEIPEQYLDMVICSYLDQTITLADFVDIYTTLGIPERPFRYQGRERVIQVVHKHVFDQVLPDYAEQRAKILEIPEVAATLENRREQFLVYRLYQDQVKDETSVTDREVREYYDENRETLRTQEKRDFSICLVGSEETAGEVSARARRGEKFELLVRDFSQDPSAKENLGRTGMVASGNYPDYDPVAFALPSVGSVSDPFQTARGWAVIKVEQIEQGRVPTYNEAYDTIHKALLEAKSEEVLQEKLEQWKKDYVITIDRDNLAKVELGLTKL
ncbi:MAG: peptidyl-prolyl cis-trans isomerase [Candidatus Krumholzibacteriota bacterium]|nr:peptidyl-prolyl cis-trans isomerase [Candidatus Krumholzibacteriota bacterium]